MNWEKREKEIKGVIFSCIEGNIDWTDRVIGNLITQEKQMLSKFVEKIFALDYFKGADKLQHEHKMFLDLKQDIIQLLSKYKD